MNTPTEDKPTTTRPGAKERDPLRASGDGLTLKGLDGQAIWLRDEAVHYVRAAPRSRYGATSEDQPLWVTEIGTAAGILVVSDLAADIAAALEL